MRHQFDVGYSFEPFRSLAGEYPGEDVYPTGQFRVEWDQSFIEAGWTVRPESLYLVKIPHSTKRSYVEF